MFRISRCIAVESNLVVARGWAKRRERTASRLGVSFGWRKWGRGSVFSQIIVVMVRQL